MDDISYMPSFMSPSKVLSDRDPSRWKNPTPTSLGLPHSNRDNIMDALRNLQNKIHNLEIERLHAQDSVRALSSETAVHRSALHEAREKRAAADESVSRQAQDLQVQLSSAELRCRQLDEQLESMRRLVREAELERRLAADRDERLRRVQATSTERAVRGQSSELVALRREHEHLSAVQAQAEGKIRALEDQLNEERHHRRLLQEHSAEVASQAEANRILLRAFSPTRVKSAAANSAQEAGGKLGKRSHQKPNDKQKMPGPHRSTEPIPVGATAEHYRLNLAHIPFVVGQATTASHSLGANVQRVIAMMKYHNPRLCAAAATAARCRHRSASSSAAARRPSRPGSSASAHSHSTAGSASGDGGDSGHAEDEAGEKRCLGDILEQLQVEFSHLTLEHQELMRRIGDVLSEQQAAQLRAELAGVVAKMEAKGDQIANVVRYLEGKLEAKPRTKSRRSRKQHHQAAAEHAQPASSSAAPAVTVTARVKTKDRSGSGIVVPVGASSPSKVHRSPGHRRETLCALRDVKTLQTQLKPTDLVWA